MSLISKVRKQDAVWWPMTGRDRYAEVTYGDPVEIKVRWTEKADEMRGPGGAVVEVHALVYADHKLHLDQGLRIGDLLWLGKLEDFPGTWESPKDAGADDIKAMATTPNLKNTETLMILGL